MNSKKNVKTMFMSREMPLTMRMMERKTKGELEIELIKKRMIAEVDSRIIELGSSRGPFLLRPH